MPYICECKNINGSSYNRLSVDVLLGNTRQTCFKLTGDGDGAILGNILGPLLGNVLRLGLLDCSKAMNWGNSTYLWAHGHELNILRTDYPLMTGLVWHSKHAQTDRWWGWCNTTARWCGRTVRLHQDDELRKCHILVSARTWIRHHTTDYPLMTGLVWHSKHAQTDRWWGWCNTWDCAWYAARWSAGAVRLQQDVDWKNTCLWEQQ